ncbi:hypothetical protein K523DRAFT_326311 [Schizophyllum commune Tattone D]|nr:hypothetical protein K523DRAFT_326311 [Schizophyllum commune Tattone D]
MYLLASGRVSTRFMQYGKLTHLVRKLISRPQSSFARSRCQLSNLLVASLGASCVPSGSLCSLVLVRLVLLPKSASTRPSRLRSCHACGPVSLASVVDSARRRCF